MADTMDVKEFVPSEGEEVMDEPMGEAEFDEDEVGKERKLTADGGVTKKLLVAGSGWEKPETGDDVSVHYVGTLLDGTKFDSSRDRNTPFTFKLGKGNVIKGWDTGVATMKKGEKALLTCAPEYAYGKAGSPPKIPADATLQFEVELLSWKSEKDISDDGGVLKTITAEGSGWAHPKELDEVAVSYSVRVQGAAEPCLATGPEGVEFELQQGHLCRAVPLAVKTMKKGEQATLLVQPEYGFGSEGSAQHSVPGGAVLEVQLQLLGWKRVDNIDGDGRVMKKILVGNDDEYKRPNEGAQAVVSYTARLPDGTVFEEQREMSVVIDEDQLPPGLDQGIQHMHKGERAIITVAPELAYGPGGWQGQLAAVPADTSVSYEVELLSFDNAPESWEMSDQQKLDAAQAKKEKGNKAFKEGKHRRAAQLYEKAVGLVQYDSNFPEALKTSSKEVKKSCWLNLAACCLKLGKSDDVVKHCGKVLELEPCNTKALYRRAQAYMSSADYVEAEMDVKKGLGAEEGNKDLLALLQRLKVLQKQQNKKAAAVYSKMFAAPKKAAAPKETAAAAAAAAGDKENDQITGTA